MTVVKARGRVVLVALAGAPICLLLGLSWWATLVVLVIATSVTKTWLERHGTWD